MFHRKDKNKAAVKKSLKALTRLQSADALLQESRRQTALLDMQKNMHLSDARYKSLAFGLVQNIAQYCQLLPDSLVGFYQHAGGLLDHALARTDAALSLFKPYLASDKSGQYTDVQSLWQYALFSASLLQGVGKLCVDYSVTVFDHYGELLTTWNPLQESLLSKGSYYEYAFVLNRDEHLRRRLNTLLARQLMPASGFHWIASDKRVLAIWLALLHEDLYSAGTLGCILDTADAIALQEEAERLMKHLKKLSSASKVRLGTFTDRTHDTAQLAEQQTGLEFIQWVQQSLAKGTFVINKTPLFSVPGGLLMSSDIFKLFVRENPGYKNWQAVQKGLTSLNLHEKGLDGSDLSSFEQHKTHKIISGIVFGRHFSLVLPGKATMLNLDSGEEKQYGRTELVNQIHGGEHFRARGLPSTDVAPLDMLNAQGQWVGITQEQSVSMQPSSRK